MDTENISCIDKLGGPDMVGTLAAHERVASFFVVGAGVSLLCVAMVFLFLAWRWFKQDPEKKHRQEGEMFWLTVLGVLALGFGIGLTSSNLASALHPHAAVVLDSGACR